MQEETIVIEPTPEKQTIPQEKKKGKGCFGCLLGCFAIVVVVVLLGLAAIWSLNGKLTVFTGNLQKIDREDLEEEFEGTSKSNGKIAVIDVFGIILNENGGYSENADSTLIAVS